MLVAERQEPRVESSNWRQRLAASRLGRWTAARSGTFWVFVVVTVAYAISNLTFSAGMDDTVLEHAVRQPVDRVSVGNVLGSIRDTYFPPNGADMPARPLRAVGSYLTGLTALAHPAFPDLLAAVMTGLSACVLVEFFRTAGLSRAMAYWSTLWFFSCVPVVAIGQICYVCQFVVIAAIYGSVALFQRFASSRQIRWLILSAAVIFVGGLYGEGVLISALAIGGLAVVWLCERRVRLACEAVAFSLLAAFLVLGGRFILTGDPAQLSQVLQHSLNLRAPDLERQRHSGGFLAPWRMIASYCGAFRRVTVTSLIFSASPFVCAVAAGAYLFDALRNRRALRALAMAVALMLALSPLALKCGSDEGLVRLSALGAALTLLCLDSIRRWPALSCMAAGGVVVLGPVIVVGNDTHTSFVLPALIAVLFIAIGKLLEAIWARGPRLLGGAMVGLLVAIGLANFVGGAYLSASVVYDSEQFAGEIGGPIRDGMVLTNSRHAFDLYVFANNHVHRGNCRGDLSFTASAVYWRGPRTIHDKRQLGDWLQRARQQQKKAYFLVYDHDRVAQKTAFHGPRYLDDDHRFKLLATRVFRASAWCLDPLYLAAGWCERHGVAEGFISYPVFPDIVDDVGLEYTPFQRRLYAVYRLLEVDPTEPGSPAPKPAVVREDYRGYRIVAAGASFVAEPRPDAEQQARLGTIRSSKLDNVLREIRSRDGHPTECSVAIEILEDDAFGTRIVRCDGSYFVFALAGPFDLSMARAANHSACHESATLEEAREWSLTSMRMGAELCAEGVHGFNIVKCGDKYFGVQQSDGPFVLERALGHKYSVCFQGTSLEQVKQLIEQRATTMASRNPTPVADRPLGPELCAEGVHGFNIIKCGDKYFGLRQCDGGFVFEKALGHKYPVCLEGTSVEQVKQLIEEWIATTASRPPSNTQSTNLAPPAASAPKLCVANLHGFNVIRVGDKYFGLRQCDGAFDAEKALGHKYSVCLEGTSVEQVKQLIENSAATTAGRAPNNKLTTN